MNETFRTCGFKGDYKGPANEYTVTISRHVASGLKVSCFGASCFAGA